MKYIFFFFTALFLCTGIYLFAQPAPTQQFLPKVVPTDPDATGLGRFGTYKVNLFTGIPDISIPIFDIQVGDLKVPISINYHSSGVKVNDVSSRVGAGWSLQTGGSITRKVRGNPDDDPNAYLSATSTSANRVRSASEINTTTQDGVDYLNHVYLKYYDVQPDIFSYSFPGHSGSFIFNQKNANFSPVLIPFEPVKINWSLPSPYNLSLGITDESGIDYKFGAGEYTKAGSGITQDAMSAWMLTQMISANKQDTILFNYSLSAVYSNINSYFSHYFIVNDNVINFTEAPVYSADAGTFYSDLATVSTRQQIITDIVFRGGKITFENAGDTRQDNNGSLNLASRLRYIKVYSYDAANGSYILIKTVELFHSYFASSDGSTKRLRLDGLKITGGSSSNQSYTFDYNNSTLLPGRFSTSIDYWGYFNNRSNNIPGTSVATTVPKTQIFYTACPSCSQTQIYIGGDNPNARDPDPNYNQAAVLQKITYPTGGYTLFEYETNQYQENTDPPQYAGGLRIKAIKSYTEATATPVVKTYKYGLNESGYGRKNFIPDHNFFAIGQNYKYITLVGLSSVVAGSKSQSIYFANPTIDMEPYDGSPVAYPVVTEYEGDLTNNTGKTIYTFNDRADAKTSVSYGNSPFFDTYHFIRGQLINKSVFKKTGSSTYSIVAQTTNTYQAYPLESTNGPIGFSLFKNIIYMNNNGEIEGNADSGDPVVTEKNSYQFGNYEIISGDNKLTSTTDIVYDQNDPLKYTSTTTNYTYDDKTHLQINQSQTANSKGEVITSGYTHPYNYGTAPYTNMTTNHIWDKVVQETITNSVSGQLSQKTTNYSSFSGNNYLPGNIQLKIKSNNVETRASFNQYDIRGNILEMQKSNDAKQSFIWDYKNMQPIAEVVNAGLSDIAYTSFESDGKGNWTYTGNTYLDPTAPTGRRYYTLGNSITKSGLSTTTTYIVSYWKKSGTVAVNSTTPTTGRSVNGWTYYEHKVVNPAGGIITVSGTSGIIDELRLYPATNAQMTTYTYDPLIGLTSKCDANNRVLYYEYDGLQRLILVRDQDRNILKQFCYNYAGQTENCSIVYNQQQGGIYYKTGCTGCLAGSAVTYTVPANTYSAPTLAEANQLALNDVNINGQAYANANGTCTTPANATVSGNNANSVSFTFTFHNNCTGTNYNFSLAANQATLINLGSVQSNAPGTTYNVTFNPPSSSAQFTFRINTTYTLHANSGTISNVPVGTGGAIVNITP